MNKALILLIRDIFSSPSLTPLPLHLLPFLQVEVRI